MVVDKTRRGAMMNGNRFPAMVVYGLAVILMVACAPDIPEPTRSPTASLEPSETAALAEATSTPEPTNTRAPTLTPRPSITLRPTRTPTKTPRPSYTPRPSLGAGPFRAVAPVDGVIPGEIGGLHTTPDGTLWLYSDQAVARLQDDDTWSIFLPEYEGHFVGIDVLGRVWIADPESTEIAVWDGENWTRYGEESGWVPPAPVWYTSRLVRPGVHTDAYGRLWLATLHDVRALDGQQWFIFGPEAMNMELTETEDISIDYQIKVNQDVTWVGECDVSPLGPFNGQGVRWFDGEWHSAGYHLGIDCVTLITVDPAGQMWIGNKLTLWQTDPNGEAWTSTTMSDETRSVTSNGYPPVNYGYPIDLDFGPSGDVWAAYIMCPGAGCDGPLAFYHIKGGIWTLVANTALVDYPASEVVILDADGTPWLFSFEGIDRVINDVREPAASLIPFFVTQDNAGRVWFIAEQDGQNWLWALDGNE